VTPGGIQNWTDALREGEAAAMRFSLPLHREKQTGMAGNWAGPGIGSSVDFQDHRPYHLGDDPRYINWQAYARTGEYTMKLYREEVSPRVDILFDASASMFLHTAKAQAAMSLLAFCIASANRAGGHAKAYFSRVNHVHTIDTSALLAGNLGNLAEPGEPEESPTLAVEQVPWRRQSMRVIISDLLFTQSPENILRHSMTEKAQKLLFVPWAPEEAEPEWEGDLELVDCETKGNRIQHVHTAAREQYRRNYQKHFSNWRAVASARGASLVRIGAGVALRQSLLENALPQGAVELWS